MGVGAENHCVKIELGAEFVLLELFWLSRMHSEVTTRDECAHIIFFPGQMLRIIYTRLS